MNSIRVDYVSEEARDLAIALESGEVTVEDLPATVVASLRQALCAKLLPGAALLAAYPHVRAVEYDAGRACWEVSVVGERECVFGCGDTFDVALRHAEARVVKAGEKE